MKAVADLINNFSDAQLTELEEKGTIDIVLTNATYPVTSDDVEIIAEDVPGWQVTNLGKLTVALDINISTELKEEGVAREVINRIQNLRKDLGFEVIDKIKITLQNNPVIAKAVANNLSYICAETLATSLNLSENLTEGDKIEIEETELIISIKKD